LIELAIERGVPLFNNGDIDGCAAIYEVTIEALRTMKTVPQASQKVLLKALEEARATEVTRDQAWILRSAMDQTWNVLQSQE
jgi:NAD-dependent DNA ligase